MTVEDEAPEGPRDDRCDGPRQQHQHAQDRGAPERAVQEERGREGQRDGDGRHACAEGDRARDGRQEIVVGADLDEVAQADEGGVLVLRQLDPEEAHREEEQDRDDDEDEDEDGAGNEHRPGERAVAHPVEAPRDPTGHGADGARDRGHRPPQVLSDGAWMGDNLEIGSPGCQSGSHGAARSSGR